VTLFSLAAAAIALASGSATASTDLRITAWPEGPDKGRAQVWRLRCDPAGGTLPRPAAACRRLSTLTRPFAPVPKDTACTQIFGGPQVARVIGVFRGRRVWVTFNRTDGCQIDRWNRHRFLFPIPTGPS
jgi:hypothetical protein